MNDRDPRGNRDRFRRRRLAVVAVLAFVFGLPALTAGAATPSGVADDRFDQITGPFSGFVVRPTDFGMDANLVLADIPSLMASVDGDRAESFVESLAFPRTSAGPPEARQQATDLVADTFRDAGYEPQFQSVVLAETGNDMPNVYAELAGTQCPEKVLVVGAHYDSATEGGPGADDNATGVAGMFELARALHDNPLPLTVRFVGWSYEEDGLVGAFAMAQRDKELGTEIVGATSLEMIGFTTPAIDPLTNIEGTYLAMITDPMSAPMARAFGAAAYTYTPEFPAFGAVIDPAILPDIYRSDHAAYALNGYPALMATDTANFRNPNYHTVNDTTDTLDWDFLRNSSRAALAGAATYASSDQNSDGYADLCGAPPSGPIGPTTPIDTGEAPAGVAERRVATPRFTG